MSMDNSNSVVVNNPNEVGFRQSPYRPEYPGGTQSMLDTSRSGALAPQVMVLLLMCGIRRCWKWALFLGLIAGASGAGTIWTITPTKFESSCLIYAAPTPPHLVFQIDKGGQNEYTTFLATQQEMIRSRKIMGLVLEDPRIRKIPILLKQKDPVEWLGKNIQFSRKANSSYFSIAFQDENPEDARNVVAVVMEKFLDRYKYTQVEDENNILQHLHDEKSAHQLLVTNLQNSIKETLKGAAKGMTTIQGDPMSYANSDSIKKDVILAEAQLEQLRAQLETLKATSMDEKDIPDILIQDAIQNDAYYNDLQSLIAGLAARITTQSRLVNSNDPTIRNLEFEKKEREEELAEYRRTLVDTKRGEILERMKMDSVRDIWAMEHNLKAQETYVKILREKAVIQQVEIAEQKVDTADVAFQQAELARETKVLDLLSEKLVSITTEKRAPSRIIPLVDPEVPREPMKSQRIMMTVAAGVGLFFAPFFFGIALEIMKPRVYHVSQVRNAAPGILIGEIMEPPVAWLHGAAFRKRLARYRESVHNWCTHLLLADPFRHCQTLAVASVAGDDGKTFLAIQVASAMAQMKSGPVLLIDGDMRVGRLHLLFGNEESGPGLADVLSFRKGIGEAVVMNEKEPNLHLLSAGNLDVSPYELLGDGRFRELLDTLATHYSMIMVVVPPVAHAAESLMMAASVDSVVLCVRQGETVLAAMEDVFRKLINTGANLDGIVVKDIPYSHMAGKDGGFSDKVEQIRLAHLLKQSDAY